MEVMERSLNGANPHRLTPEDVVRDPRLASALRVQEMEGVTALAAEDAASICVQNEAEPADDAGLADDAEPTNEDIQQAVAMRKDRQDRESRIAASRAALTEAIAKIDSLGCAIAVQTIVRGNQGVGEFQIYATR